MEVGPNIWMDIAVIVLEADGKEFISTSAGVPFPAKFVNEAKQRGFERVTAGSLIAKANEGVDKANPHLFLTGGTTSRSKLLEDAVAIAFSLWEKSK